MKKIITLFFILFSFHLTLFSQVKIQKTPSWVINKSYNKNPSIDQNDITQGLLTLLYEEQTNIDKEESFVKISTKIVENVGTQSASNIDINFDPTYQKLFFHSINIIRNEKVINKLFPNSFQTLRKELNADSFIYDGSISAMTNLSDVRVGDIIEYSYSLKGFNPIHNKHYSSTFNLKSSNPIGKMHIGLLSKKPLTFKYFKTNKKVEEKKVGNYYSYSIEDENIEAFKYEDQTPGWNIESGILNVSNYSSWSQVVDWGVNVYNYNKNLSSDLNKKITEIKNSTNNEGERIEAALSFVQDEIRYLGLENGIGAYKPFPPNKVFKQRYGDCKDKSILFVAMLKKMGIEAYPVLVNSYLKNTIREFLPSPYLFDHCVAKVVTSDGGEYWYDPTISNQGGVYYNISFPDYRNGLVLKKGVDALEKISPNSNSAVNVTDNYIINEIGKGASLEINSVYIGAEADYMRSFFKNNSLSSIKKEFESYYSKYFDNIKSSDVPEFKDDRKNNIFSINESYKIDSVWKPSVVTNKKVVEFYPYTIVDVLSMPAKSERKTPFALAFPTTRNHVINVTLPDDWSMSQKGLNINSSNLYYDLEIAYLPKKRFLTLNHSLKIQKDHVTVEEFPTYYQNLKKLDNNIVYSIINSKDDVNSGSSFSFLKILGFLIFWGALTVFIWLAIKLYKYDPEPKIESSFEKNKPIGGWLILIGIGLCITPFRTVFDLFSDTVYISGEWMLYFSIEDINSVLGMLLFLETIVNAAILVVFPVMIILFFNKRSSFPKLYAIVIVSNFIFIGLDYFIAISFTDVNLENTQMNKELVRMFISTAILVPYLLISERVKETFVKRL